MQWNYAEVSKSEMDREPLWWDFAEFDRSDVRVTSLSMSITSLFHFGDRETARSQCFYFIHQDGIAFV